MKIKNYIHYTLICSLLTFTSATILQAKENPKLKKAISPKPNKKAQGPGKIVIETIEEGIQILEDPAYQGFDQFEARKQILWDILTPVFNFEETSKRALGHHWKGRTKEERNEFISVFAQVLRDIYLGKTDTYAGGKFVYIREIVKGKRGKVRTNFFTSDDKKVTVDFSMQNTTDTWKIYDITIEGVSMVGSYRTQFNDMLSKSSFKELMEKLRKKRDEFVQTDFL